LLHKQPLSRVVFKKK